MKCEEVMMIILLTSEEDEMKTLTTDNVQARCEALQPSNSMECEATTPTRKRKKSSWSEGSTHNAVESPLRSDF